MRYLHAKFGQDIYGDMHGFVGDYSSDRYRPRHLPLRPTELLAARKQREHEWFASPVLSQGNGPQRTWRRRTERRCPCSEYEATQDVGLANVGGGTRPVAQTGYDGTCCDDLLNPPRVRPSVSSEAQRPLRPASGVLDQAAAKARFRFGSNLSLRTTGLATSAASQRAACRTCELMLRERRLEIE